MFMSMSLFNVWIYCRVAAVRTLLVILRFTVKQEDR